MLAVSCEYKTSEDEMIRDQRVEKTNNKKEQEALLSTPNLTLEKVVEIATRIENSTTFMEQINKASEKDLHQKVAIIKQKSNKSHVNVKAETSLRKETPKKIERFRCGSTFHLGSPYTLLSEKVRKEYFNRIELRKSHIRLVGYGGKPVEVLGEYEVELSFQAIEVPKKAWSKITADLIGPINLRNGQKGESKFSCPKKVIKICRNAVKLEDGNWWNKERLSLARDVELLNKTWDESTREEQESRDFLRKNSPCEMKVLDEELKRPAKEEYVTKDMKRKASSRSRMLPSKYRDFVLFV
ncbi:hypothetical protein NDU88_000220 [Pleurodeles waltl]|uniref:Uncharacterized protein n=1 Tax=Pleurodeles waltl TaxID=8319 RepID=A0AAV7UR79_PLEWA|nr:hypothetical protein NDU88_000220 [Pleurodeles waltl]